MINSKTLGDAVAYLEKYYRIISDTDHLKAYNQKDKAYLTYALLETSYKSRIHTAEIILSYIYKALKFLTKNSLILDEVVLCYKKPEYYRLYEEVFNAPVKFSKTHNSLVFDKNYLEIPLSQPSRELFDMFEKYAQSALNKLNPEHYYSSKVWEVCRNNFASGIPKIEDVARVFLMTGRNLQFKLREEGTSFRKIVTELVKEVATSYLKNVNLSIAQVSHLAGFSQPSAFNRSYKRWTGKSPGEHRSEIV
jgi:AraC-like DNA-binding protein